MTALRILVVDDEPLARDALDALLAEEPDATVVGHSGTGRAAIAAIRDLRPDLVFLDIALPDLDGFQVIEQLDPGRRPEIVFVTAHSDQALRAFEVRALDYVTKPLRRSRVREAVARARDRIGAARPDAGTVVRHPTFLALKTDGRLQLLDPATIDWIAADDDHVVVHAAGRTWRARETLGAIGRRLDPERFVRIHRSTIVRLSGIREMQPWFHGDYVVFLRDGTQLRLSRTYRDRVARLLGRAV